MTKSQPKTPADNAAPVRTTKTDQLLRHLKTVGGIDLDELCEALGWQKHTVRATISGLRGKGFSIVHSRVDGIARYMIDEEPAA